MKSSPLSDAAPSVVARDFLPEPASARAARHFVADVTAVDDVDVGFRLAALTSELANNAVIHARTPFTVGVLPGETRIRVTVSDGSVTPPVPRSLGPDHPSGRGLRIVEALADDWGFSLEKRGKTVWFEVLPPSI
jgi:hypothetical protein